MYGKYGVEVGFDNLKFKKVMKNQSSGDKIIFGLPQNNKYFEPVKFEDFKNNYVKAIEEEENQIDVPIYKIVFDKSGYWNKIDNAFGINANKIKSAGKASATFEAQGEEYNSKIR